MSIEYRGEGKYRFRVQKDGISYTQNYFSDKKITEKEINDKKYPKEVTDAHKKFEVDILRKRIGYNENMKFSELCQLVFDEHTKKNTSLNTQNTYRNFYNNHALEYFGNLKLSRIKKINVQKFVNLLSDEFKYNSVKQYFGILKLTFGKAVDWGILTENPCLNISLQKNTEIKKYTELLSNDELQALFDAIRNEQNTILKTIYTIGIGMGMRQGEILGLSLKDIDFNKNTIDINKQYLRYTTAEGKSGKKIDVLKTKNSYRKIYMTNLVADTLKDYTDNLKVIDLQNQYLFMLPGTNKIMPHGSVYYFFSKMLKEKQLKPIAFHDLRHLHATMLINNGANVVSIAKRLGDTVETISNTYLHSIEKVDKEAVEKLDLYIEKAVNLP